MGKHLAPPPEPRPRVQRWTALQRIGLVAAAFFAIALGALTFRSIQMHESPATVLGDLTVPTPQSLFGKDRLLVLLLGLDYNYDAKDQEYSKGARSDVIKVVALDVPSSTMHILSVPRDMYVVLPSGYGAKINQAYSDGGIVEAEKVVADFLGLPRGSFDRYIILRANATKDLVDAIGGIDVKVERKMDYDDHWGHLSIHLKPGLIHMNGEQAVGYARFRHDETGDIGRIKRQDQVLRLAIAKLKNSKFNDVVHAKDLISATDRNIETNLTATEKLSLARAFSGVNLQAMKTEQIPYTADKDLPNAGNVLIADDDAKRKLVAKLLTGPIGPQPTPQAADLAAIIPSSVRVDVRNGTGQPGMGAKMASALKARGFAIAAVGNADSFGYEATEIHVHSAVKFAGEKVLSVIPLPTASITPDVAASPAAAPVSDVTVIVGRDFASASSHQASAVK